MCEWSNEEVGHWMFDGWMDGCNRWIATELDRWGFWIMSSCVTEWCQWIMGQMITE